MVFLAVHQQEGDSLECFPLLIYFIFLFFKKKYSLLHRLAKQLWFPLLPPFPPPTCLAYRILPHTPATTIINYFSLRQSEIEGMSLQKALKKKFCILIALYWWGSWGIGQTGDLDFSAYSLLCNCSVLSNSYQYFQAKHSGFDLLLLHQWMLLSVFLLLMSNIAKLFGELIFFQWWLCLTQQGKFVKLPLKMVRNSEVLCSHNCLYWAFVCARGRH